MWVHEPRREFGLATKAAAHGRGHQRVGRAHLYGDAPAQQRIERLPDDRESAATCKPSDAVATDLDRSGGRLRDAAGTGLTEQQQKIERSRQGAVLGSEDEVRIGNVGRVAAKEVVDRSGTIDDLGGRFAGLGARVVRLHGHARSRLRPGRLEGIHARRIDSF